MVTGTDLVQWQLEVAAGNRLPQLQDELQCTGHAFEARIYAENTDTGFLPDTGRLTHLRAPTPSRDVRVETGVRSGDTISVHYDPMIAKLVVHGQDRQEALRRLAWALSEYEVVGVHTNIGFLQRLARSPDFAAGLVETGYIDKHRDELFPPADSKSAREGVALAGLALMLNRAEIAARDTQGSARSPWAAQDAFRIASPGLQTAQVLLDGRQYRVDLSLSTLSVTDVADGHTVAAYDNVKPEWTPPQSATGASLRVLLGDRLCAATAVFSPKDASVTIFDQGDAMTFQVPQPKYFDEDVAASGGSVTAPMSCKIVQVLVEAGAQVAKDTPLVVLEAMKMEHVIKAPAAGTVTDVYYKVGELVDEGKSLVAFEPDSK
ncbi:hypothetical protein GGI07_000354 [Coemansia sp. Benny D115]|nr:hypothetical protein GGI07_000354 [Coemansia sp. Benny D115]